MEEVKVDYGYCVRCKAKKEFNNPSIAVMKNNREAMRGDCIDCGKAMFKILGKKEPRPEIEPDYLVSTDITPFMGLSNKTLGTILVFFLIGVFVGKIIPW